MRCSACGKVGFPTYRRAKARAKFITDQGTPMRVYRCEYGWFHLTRKNKKDG